MSSVLSADFCGNPLPLATWQDDFEREVDYFTHLYKRRFRNLTPELREEQVQEALVQTAQVFANQYGTHGGRTEHRHSIARYIARRVKLGRSCTRPHGRNADLLDRSQRTTGPQREVDCLSILEHVRAGRELSDDFRLDFLAFVDSLTDTLRQYALLAYHGTPENTIALTMGVHANTISRYRQRLRRRWEIDQAA